MNELVAIEKIAQWETLKALVLDSASSPIAKQLRADLEFTDAQN